MLNCLCSVGLDTAHAINKDEGVKEGEKTPPNQKTKHLFPQVP